MTGRKIPGFKFHQHTLKLSFTEIWENNSAQNCTCNSNFSLKISLWVMGSHICANKHTCSKSHLQPNPSMKYPFHKNESRTVKCAFVTQLHLLVNEDIHKNKVQNVRKILWSQPRKRIL